MKKKLYLLEFIRIDLSKNKKEFLSFSRNLKIQKKMLWKMYFFKLMSFSMYVTVFLYLGVELLQPGQVDFGMYGQEMDEWKLKLGAASKVD